MSMLVRPDTRSELLRSKLSRGLGHNSYGEQAWPNDLLYMFPISILGIRFALIELATLARKVVDSAPSAWSYEAVAVAHICLFVVVGRRRLLVPCSLACQFDLLHCSVDLEAFYLAGACLGAFSAALHASVFNYGGLYNPIGGAVVLF
jgi:cytochrome b6-f complex subunit 4